MPTELHKGSAFNLLIAQGNIDRMQLLQTTINYNVNNQQHLYFTGNSLNNIVTLI
jgi:hypothetical protein